MMTIRAALPSDRDALLDVWLRSVRATHTFLTEDDIQGLLPLVRDAALPALELWVLCGDGDEAIGFLGLDGAKLEALFLAPEHRRRGGGRLLVEHARRLKGPLTVDVNEQNPEAVRFYQALGFRVVGRSPLDGQGRPFPLLHLREGPDYPAAHSMDTAWFATDRDGQVAEFYTGEDGDLPEAWGDWAPVAHAITDAGLTETFVAQLRDEVGDVGGAELFTRPLDLKRLLGMLELVADRDGLLLWRDWPHSSRPRYHLPSLLAGRWADPAARFDLNQYALLHRGRAAALVVVTDPQLLRDAIAAGTAVAQPQEPAGPPWIYRVDGLTQALARRLVQSPACLVFVRAQEEGPEVVPSPEGRGLFTYHHPGGSGVFAYEREGMPETPVHLDQLSPLARAVVGRVRFDHLSFSTADRFHPMTYLPCSTWSGQRPHFLDPRTRTWRPAPGQEAAFAAADLPQWGDARDEAAVAPAADAEQRARLLQQLGHWQEATPDEWARMVADRVGAWRQAPLDVAEVTFEMDRCGLMQSLLQEYLAQPGAYRVWRGHNFGLQLHDYGTPLGDRGPEHFYRWLAGTVRSRPLPEPQVAVTDCLFAAQLLYEGDRADHLHALRQRLRAQGWPPADADLAAAPAWPAERITDTMTGLVLDLIGWHNPVPVDPRRWEALVTAFTPLLTAVTAEQYELIESLASRAPTCYPVEALRLHLLLLMARQRRPVTGPGRTVAQLLQMARNHLAPAEADALARTAEDAGYVVPPEPPAGPPFDEPWPPGAEEDIPF